MVFTPELAAGFRRGQQRIQICFSMGNIAPILCDSTSATLQGGPAGVTAVLAQPMTNIWF
jgi:hypothetical protein